jgi:outer membrane protein assembly factor BamB
VFHRIDRKTGEIEWATSVRGKSQKQYFFHGDAFIGFDRVFVGADTPPDSEIEGGVHAFESSTGKELWKFTSGRGVLAKLISEGRGLFAVTTKKEFLRLDQASGKPTWVFPLQWSAWEAPAAKDNRIFVGSKEGVIYAFDTLKGSTIWQTNVGGPICTSICAFDDSIYAGTADGRMHRVGSKRGTIHSSLRLDETLNGAGLPVISDKSILVLQTDARNDYRAIASVDLELTKVHWRRAAPDKWTTSRLFVAGESIVLGRPGEVIGYSRLSGERLWSMPLVGTIRSIGGNDGVLFVGTTEGTLYAVRQPTVPFNK